MPALRALGHEVTVVDTVSGPLTPAASASCSPQAVASRAADAGASSRGSRRSENLPALVVEPARSRAADLVFLVLHGRRARAARCRRCSSSAGLRYTGSGPLGSGMAMDKEVTKRLLRGGRDADRRLGDVAGAAPRGDRRRSACR